MGGWGAGGGERLPGWAKVIGLGYPAYLINVGKHFRKHRYWLNRFCQEKGN